VAAVTKSDGKQPSGVKEVSKPSVKRRTSSSQKVIRRGLQAAQLMRYLYVIRTHNVTTPTANTSRACTACGPCRHEPRTVHRGW